MRYANPFAYSTDFTIYGVLCNLKTPHVVSFIIKLSGLASIKTDKVPNRISQTWITDSKSGGVSGCMQGREMMRERDAQ